MVSLTNSQQTDATKTGRWEGLAVAFKYATHKVPCR